MADNPALVKWRLKVAEIFPGHWKAYFRRPGKKIWENVPMFPSSKFNVAYVIGYEHVLWMIARDTKGKAT